MIIMNKNRNPIINDMSINRLIDIESQKKLGSLIKLFNATNKCELKNMSIDNIIIFI